MMFTLTFLSRRFPSTFLGNILEKENYLVHSTINRGILFCKNYINKIIMIIIITSSLSSSTSSSMSLSSSLSTSSTSSTSLLLWMGVAYKNHHRAGNSTHVLDAILFRRSVLSVSEVMGDRCWKDIKLSVTILETEQRFDVVLAWLRVNIKGTNFHLSLAARKRRQKMSRNLAFK